MAEVGALTKSEILLKVEEILKEEKWTRATIDSYLVKNFIELDNLIRNAVEEGYKEDLKNICRENLKHSPNSVVSLYIFGILSLEESAVDDTHIPQIIKLFMDNKKYKIAEFLANKILSYREHKFALKTLETIYESTANQEELFNIKKRLVLVDNKDALNAKLLGEYYERENDRELAMFYYRLAFERVIASRLPKMIEELWGRIIKQYPNDSELAINLARKAREVLGDSKTANMLYEDFVKRMMKNGKFKDALNVLKFALDLKPQEKIFRKAIEDCYREIYKDHSQLEKYLKLSSISQTWKPHKDAIRIFETHIAFDKGVYVFHKTWGLGVVLEITGDKIKIDFENKKGHEMSLDIALRALEVLDNDHILIWKKIKKDELKKVLWEDPLRVIEIILKSNNGKITLSELKDYLVGDVITANEWNRWWNLAKKLMVSSERIVHSVAKKNLLELRESELTITEEIINRFKKSTNFENKVKLAVDFKLQGGDINSEKATAVVNYFVEILKSANELPERKIISWLILKYEGYKDIENSRLDISELFRVKSLTDLFTKIDIELKKTFLDMIKKDMKDWDVKFVDFIVNTPLTRLHRYMWDELENAKKYEIINNIYLSLMNNFRDKCEYFVWVSRILFEESNNLMKTLGIKDSEIIIRLISLIDFLNEEIEKKNEIARNKRVLDGIEDLLFKKGKLKELIENEDETTVKSILLMIESSSYFIPDEKSKYIALIYSKYPSLKRMTPTEQIVTMRHPFLVSKKAYDAKKQELVRLVNVEIPENSRAIGEAMEKGDLRENAEYKAALEKQDQLKATVSRLETELSQAKIINRDEVKTNFVDVGTKVTIQNKKGEKLVYQILGQWDVNIEKNIISYHSPLGKNLLDRKVGEKLLLEIGGEKQEWEIVKIELADFD
ncbi:MAG: transcription elongation factor GreA [Brevinematia bacterium]